MESSKSDGGAALNRSEIDPPIIFMKLAPCLRISRVVAITFRRAIIKVGMKSSAALSAASRDPLNPLAPPGGRLEGIGEILCLVHDLAVAELHNTHCVCWSPWYVIVYSVIQISPFPRIRLTL